MVMAKTSSFGYNKGKRDEKPPKTEEEVLNQAFIDFDLALASENENRRETLESILFVDGEQWPLYIKRERERDGRPCITVNKLRKFVKQMVGDIRQNRPAIKVTPVDNEADVIGAQVRQDLIRHIEQQSNADTIYDTAAEHALDGGYGFWRVVPGYSDDDFDQEIRLKAVNNRFTVYLDQNAQEYTFEDGRYAFVTDWLTRQEFKQRFPNDEPVDFEPTGSVGDQYDYWSWVDADRVRIAEYFYKLPYEKEIAQLDTGEIIELKDGLDVNDLEAQGMTVARTRKVKTDKVMWVLMHGDGILEGPTEIPCKYIPIVPVLGNEVNIEGRRKFRSLIWDAMDPMRMYNYWRTHATEIVALAPKAPFMLTPEQIKGFENDWQDANRKNFPYLLYNQMPGQGAPQRQAPPPVPSGVVNEAAIAGEDIKDAIGMFEASLGQPSNERSGRAILARQREADATTYTFIDNLQRSIVYTGKILLDMMPRVYDTERIIRLRGQDGDEGSVELNRVIMDLDTMEPVIVNDLTVGKYDFIPTAGANYQSKRQEIAASMLDVLQFAPEGAPVMIPKIAKLLDWEGAQELAEELKMIYGMAGPEGTPAPPPGETEVQPTQAELPL
jgi:hypothetical protein